MAGIRTLPVKRVKAWVTSLDSEPEEALRKLGKRLAKVVAAGEAVLDQRDVAASSRAVHRTLRRGTPAKAAAPNPAPDAPTG